jgi:hypothetical protein
VRLQVQTVSPRQQQGSRHLLRPPRACIIATPVVAAERCARAQLGVGLRPAVPAPSGASMRPTAPPDWPLRTWSSEVLGVLAPLLLVPSTARPCMSACCMVGSPGRGSRGWAACSMGALACSRAGLACTRGGLATSRVWAACRGAGHQRRTLELDVCAPLLPHNTRQGRTSLPRDGRRWHLAGRARPHIQKRASAPCVTASSAAAHLCCCLRGGPSRCPLGRVCARVLAVARLLGGAHHQRVVLGAAGVGQGHLHGGQAGGPA